MKFKNLIVPILILLAIVIIIDRIVALNPTWKEPAFGKSAIQNFNDSRNTISEIDSEDMSSVTYLCAEGVVEADFGPDSVGILLPDDRIFYLPQIQSTSTLRFEKDGMELIMAADQAEIVENQKAIYSDCKATQI